MLTGLRLVFLLSDRDVDADGMSGPELRAV